MTTLPRSRRAPTTDQETSTDDLLTVREVARKLRVDDTTVRRWIKSGTLAAVTLPHAGNRQAYRIRRRDYERIVPSDEKRLDR